MAIPIGSAREPHSFSIFKFVWEPKMTHRGFFISLKKKNQTQNTNSPPPKPTQTLFVFPGEQIVHSFTIRCILQFVLLPQGQTIPYALNRWEGGKSGRTVPHTSLIPSLAAPPVCGNKATCFVSKPMPSNPAYLQCKLYIPPKLRISRFARDDLLFHFIFK